MLHFPRISAYHHALGCSNYRKVQFLGSEAELRNHESVFVDSGQNWLQNLVDIPSSTIIDLIDDVMTMHGWLF
jgi:hypothetical protein